MIRLDQNFWLEPITRLNPQPSDSQTDAVTTFCLSNSWYFYQAAFSLNWIGYMFAEPPIIAEKIAIN